MKVQSINIAKKEEINFAGKIVETGIFKKPILNSASVTKLGIDGDIIADKAVHGGEDQAIYIYGLPDYDWWSRELGKTIPPGTFGENLTITEFGTEALMIGDRLRINNVLLEISAPRTPCFKLAARMDNPHFLKHFVKAVKPGAYARVLNEGVISIGDEVELIKTNYNYSSINEIFVEWHSNNQSITALRKALDSPISRYHKSMIQEWYDEKVKN